jgi:hypothetical protein
MCLLGSYSFASRQALEYILGLLTQLWTASTGSLHGCYLCNITQQILSSLSARILVWSQVDTNLYQKARVNSLACAALRMFKTSSGVIVIVNE